MSPYTLLRTLAVLALPCAGFSQWTEPQPARVPWPRAHMAMTFDVQRGHTVMFGGVEAPTGGSTHLDETWTYDGATWTQQQPTVSPPALSRTTLVYDHARRVCVLFGGAGPFSTLGLFGYETWEWDGTEWTRPRPRNDPGGRHSHAMAYDIARQRIVLYGGQRSTLSANSDTWEYDGNDWTQVSVSGPGRRTGASMCYHAGLGKMVLFGGIDPFSGGLAGTWLYDGTSWTELTLATEPPVREGASMVYDAARDVCVLQGGFDGSAPASVRQDTWEFDGARWKRIADTIGTPRARAGLAMDGVRQRVVMFGGFTSMSSSSTSDVTSELGGYFRTIGTSCQGSRGVPTLSSSTIPQLGSPLTIDLQDFEPATATALLYFGVSDLSWSGVPLPLEVSALGFTGCSIYVSWDVSLLLQVNPLGAASVTIGLPASPQFLGLEIFAQGLSVDFAANPAGLVFSNGGGAMMGL